MPPGDRPSDPPSLPATERVLAGFCHDLNGQLANASGFAYLLGPEADAEGPGRHLREALDRMEELVRQLRWLTREEARRPEPTSLADLLRALTAVLPRHPRFRTTVVTVDGPADLPAVRVDFASALRVLLLAVDAGTEPGPVAALKLEVVGGADGVAVGPAGGPTTAPRALRTALEREAAEAGLPWTGGTGGASLRVVLPRLG